jgi:deazaflavin-dependent oxidoreductase (nitroreductase family)
VPFYPNLRERTRQKISGARQASYAGVCDGTTLAKLLFEWLTSTVMFDENRKQDRIVKWTVALDRTIGRTLYRWHVSIYRLTNGVIGHKSPYGPMLVLTVKGRRTGQLHSVTLLYYASDDTYFVVGSNGGRPGHPAWLLNVRSDPRVAVQVGSRRFDAAARELTDEERTQTWPELTTFYSGWAHYETLTDRPIAVVALRAFG